MWVAAAGISVAVCLCPSARAAPGLGTAVWFLWGYVEPQQDDEGCFYFLSFLVAPRP